MSHKIFISYRRFDTAGTTGRLHDALCEAFGDQNVFRDVHDIPAGVDFREVLEQELEDCTIVLVMIGQHYTSIKDENENLRLHNPNDFVHMEVASAIRKNKIVVPVLVDGAGMPAASSLPTALQELVNFNAVVVSHDRWKSDVEVLIKKLEYHMGPANKRNNKPSKPTVVEAQPGLLKRYVGPMMMGGILTFIFLIAFAMAIPSLVDEEGDPLAMDDTAQIEANTAQDDESNTTYSASFGTPSSYDAPQERISSKQIDESNIDMGAKGQKKIDRQGGYGLPVVDDESQEKDPWGFDKKRSLEDKLVGVWEQTYPEVKGTYLRTTFGADGTYKNNYQQAYYIVVGNYIQVNGTNVIEIISVNETETQLEMKYVGTSLPHILRRIQ